MKSDEFIREVDEDLRRDRLAALGRRYGPWIAAAALAVIVGVAAGQGWRAYREHVREQEALRYAESERLLERGRAAEAAEAFAALAEDAGDGYAVLARLRAAEALREAGDEAAAAAMLETLADDDSVPELYRGLGTVLVALDRFDEADPAGLPEVLDGADGPWRYSALELTALAQLEAGDVEAARRTLGELVDAPGTPANMRRRASELLASLGGLTAPEGAAPEGEEAG